MAFILLIINLVVGLLIFFVAFLIFSPFFFVGITSTLQDPNAFGNIILIPIVLIILITIVAGSMLATFQVGSWTLLFVRLTQGGKAYSKIIRWVATLPKKIKSEKI